MKHEYILFPFYLIFAILMAGAAYIRFFKMKPTLKKYGREHRTYKSLKKDREQLDEYIELCKEHGLPDIYWRYMKFFSKYSFVFIFIWFGLLYFVYLY